MTADDRVIVIEPLTRRIVHQRDDNAAINLARYQAAAALLAAGSAVGPVGAAVKRRADRKTGTSPAGGREARKGGSRTAAEQPRDGVPSR